MWSAARIGSINYWTGDVALERKFTPKVRFRDAPLNVARSEECGAPERELRIRSIILERRGHNGAAHDALRDISGGSHASLSNKIAAVTSMIGRA
jgi:hypothetical protein